jgi:hypothetical protein
MMPNAIKAVDRWICYETVSTPDGTTKKPRAPWAVDHTGDVNWQDDAKWTDFETANEWAEKLPGWGLGFVFHESDDIAGIDLDKCVDDDEVDLWAMELVRDVDSFTEFSPSGTGLHILCYGEIGGGLKNEKEGIEIYDQDRWFTVTGDHYEGSPTGLEQRYGVLERLSDEHQVERPGTDDDSEPEPSTPPSERAAADDVDPSGPHPLYDIGVRDVYPSLETDVNIAHPIHGSSTGSNFKIFSSRPTAICWHDQHNYGRGDGCGLGAHHLLAMEFTGLDDCALVRQRYPKDDQLVHGAYVAAMQRGLLRPCEPPYRAVRYQVQQLGLDPEDLDDGGKTAWATFRAGCRIMRKEHGIEVVLDDDD